LLTTIHASFDVTLIAFFEPFASSVQAVSLTPNVGATPVCVTVIVLVIVLTPDPTVNVTVAVRIVVLVCAVALSVTSRLPLPPVALAVTHG
jgi:hypothetical protein